MSYLPLVLAASLLGISRADHATTTNQLPKPKTDKSPNRLVHVSGKFVGIQPTGKRHQSFIFSFRVEYELRGPGMQAVAKNETVRFELYQDFGGGKLVRELSGLKPDSNKSLEKAAVTVNDSKRYQLVLWRFEPNRNLKKRPQPNARLVQSPVIVKEK